MDRRVSCLSCHAELEVYEFNRRHLTNGKACILYDPEHRTRFTLAYTRYLTGWNLWTPEKEARCLSLIQAEHRRVEKRLKQTA